MNVNQISPPSRRCFPWGFHIRRNKHQRVAPIRSQGELLAIPLPLPTDFKTKNLRGPTDWSNWILRDRILMGCFPWRIEFIEPLVQNDIMTYVCLMEEHELQKHGHYFPTVQQLSMHPDILQFLHFPIEDNEPCSEDSLLINLTTKIIQQAQRGRKIYIHCYGGHGRAGMIASILIARLFDVDAKTALELCQSSHDSRADPNGVPISSIPSPATEEQREQVTRVICSLSAHKHMPKIGQN